MDLLLLAGVQFECLSQVCCGSPDQEGLGGVLAAPHHSQYRLFLDESDQVGPLNTASANRATSESRMVAASW